jgi:hypothetical protein
LPNVRLANCQTCQMSISLNVNFFGCQFCLIRMRPIVKLAKCQTDWMVHSVASWVNCAFRETLCELAFVHNSCFALDLLFQTRREFMSNTKMN